MVITRTERDGPLSEREKKKFEVIRIYQQPRFERDLKDTRLD